MLHIRNTCKRKKRILKHEMGLPFLHIQEGLGERVVFDFKSSDLKKKGKTLLSDCRT